MFRVDDTQVRRTLREGKKIHKNMKRFLSKIGVAEINMARDRIRTGKEDPNGRSWDGWAPATREARQKKGNASRGLLYDSGFLYNNFTSRATGRRVTITNRSPYASYLQNGTSRMPARPFLGWGRKSEQNIQKLYRQHIKRWK